MGMIDRRLENQWDRQLSDGLPDSRLQNREKHRVFRANMWWEPVFCSSCSRGPFGLITADWSPHVFYICDGCFETHGKPPGVTEAAVPQLDPVSLKTPGIVAG